MLIYTLLSQQSLSSHQFGLTRLIFAHASGLRARVSASRTRLVFSHLSRLRALVYELNYFWRRALMWNAQSGPLHSTVWGAADRIICNTVEKNKIKPYGSGTVKKYLCVMLCFLFKGSVSRDFRPLFFSWFKPIWAPDKQPKVFSESVSISPRNSITNDLCDVQHNAEIISTVCITLRRWSLCSPQTISAVCNTPWR